MATHVGKEGSVYVGANLVAELKGFEINESAELVEDSELSDEWKTFKSGSDVVKEWGGTITCHWDETDTSGQQAMTIGASITLNAYPEGNTTGDTYKTGTAIIESIGLSVDRGAVIERSFTVKGSGALTESTVA